MCSRWAVGGLTCRGCGGGFICGGGGVANTTEVGCPGGNEGCGRQELVWLSKEGSTAVQKSGGAGSLTCDRPGEGAGWGLEGDPVRGCGALFISWGSACGGRRVPVYKAGEKIRDVQVGIDTYHTIQYQHFGWWYDLYHNSWICCDLQFSTFSCGNVVKPEESKLEISNVLVVLSSKLKTHCFVRHFLSLLIEIK